MTRSVWRMMRLSIEKLHLHRDLIYLQVAVNVVRSQRRGERMWVGGKRKLSNVSEVNKRKERICLPNL